MESLYAGPILVGYWVALALYGVGCAQVRAALCTFDVTNQLVDIQLLFCIPKGPGVAQDIHRVLQVRATSILEVILHYTLVHLISVLVTVEIVMGEEVIIYYYLP